MCPVFAHTLQKIRNMSENLYYTALWPLKTLTNYCIEYYVKKYINLNDKVLNARVQNRLSGSRTE